MNADEIANLLEELDGDGDFYMGLPDINERSDGDSDKSDEEAEGNSERLSRFLLEAPAHIVEQQDDDGDKEIGETHHPKAKKRKMQRKWLNNSREEPVSQTVITIPPSDESMAAECPQDFFELFFNEKLFEIVLQQTNLYALQNNKMLGVTIDELKVVIGGMLHSSICKLPNKKKYWASGDHVPKLLANSIRRDRFLDILHNLHFRDNTLPTNDRAAKLRPFLDHLQEKFIQHGGFPEHFAIDESMIPYFGKHFAKQFIRGKPIRFGFKMWALCSKGGYLHSFDLYLGKTENQTLETTANIGLGGNVVLNLIRKANIPPQHGHKFFFDNYFTSISLMEEMTSRGYLASGTCRDNRTEKCPISDKNWMKKKPRGSADFRMSEGVLAMKWKDNKDVTVVTNFDSSTMKTARRYDRNARKFTTVPQPTCIDNYNTYMGFVDLMDQEVSTYRVRMRQRKWWWPIFSYMLSVTVNNAYQLMKIKGTNMSLYDFIETLAIYYCKSYGKRSIQGRKVTSKLTDIARYDGKDHWIVQCEQAKVCRHCKGRASFKCRKCDVGLHPKCFEGYHITP